MCKIPLDPILTESQNSGELPRTKSGWRTAAVISCIERVRLLVKLFIGCHCVAKAEVRDCRA